MIVKERPGAIASAHRMGIFGEDDLSIKPVSPILNHQKVQNLDFLPLDFLDSMCIVEPVLSGFRLARPGLQLVRGYVRLVRGQEQHPRRVVQMVTGPSRSRAGVCGCRAGQCEPRSRVCGSRARYCGP